MVRVSFDVEEGAGYTALEETIRFEIKGEGCSREVVEAQKVGVNRDQQVEEQRVRDDIEILDEGEGARHRV